MDMQGPQETVGLYGDKSPGATNLVNGITAAFIESTPVIAISGDVSTAFKGRDCFEEGPCIGF